MTENDTPTTPLPFEAHDPSAQPVPSAEPIPSAQPVRSDGAVPAEPFLRRHAVAVAVVAAALAVVVVAGGTAWGVSAAVASTQTAGAPMSAAAGSHVPGAQKSASRKAGTAAHATAHGVRGTITAVSGDTWTVRTAAGASMTVTLDATTAFGTKKAPATRDSFAVGDRIGVLGTRSGTTVTAKRIVHLPAASTGTPTPAPAA